MAKKTLNAHEEIKESLKTETLFNKLENILKSKKTIILTNNPAENWHINPKKHQQWVYINANTSEND